MSRLDNTIAALPAMCRDPASRLLDATHAGQGDPSLVEAAITALADEIGRLNKQVGHLMVDRDRRELAAMARAEDCDQHGEALRFERHQAHWASVLADRNDQARRSWLDAAMRIVAELRNAGLADAAGWAQRVCESAGRDQDAIYRRHKAPTIADCRQAGRCEHHVAVPHRACRELEQMELFAA